MTQEQQHSPLFLRKRKFLKVLPVWAIPFLLIFFVALGGGKGVSAPAPNKTPGTGFNTTLPSAHFTKTDTPRDKLGFYNRADEDSVKQQEKIRQDPYHANPLVPVSPRDANIAAMNMPPPADPRANQLLEKLVRLKQTIRQPTTSAYFSPAPGDPRSEDLLPSFHRHDPPAEPDTQMERLNGMLDKIIRIQHPPGDRSASGDIPTAPRATLIRITGEDSQSQTEGFYSIDDADTADPVTQNTIPALVEEGGTIITGSTITLRLAEDCAINGIPLPRDNLLYGTATLKNDRIQIMITSIRVNNSIYPVALQVFDLDGLAGIHIRDGTTREAAKQSAGDVVNGFETASFDASAGAQAASAGIQAAKTLLGKKIRTPQAFVRAGYRVLLRNNDTNHK